MRKTLNILSALALAISLAACGQSTDGAGTTTSASALTISGRVDASSFGDTVTTVRAVRGGTMIAEASVGQNGAFTMTLPKGTGYQLAFVREGGSSALVFPRQSGAIDHRFDVTGGGAFDLGVVRRIGDPASHTFRFSATRSALNADEGDTDDDDVQCEDGIDAVTGAVCVDDDDEELAGMCGGDEEDEGAEADDDDVECEDGIDPATGAECEGGPGANQDDGEDEEQEGAESDDDDVNCEDGIDPATGAECEGGPGANQDDGEDEEQEGAEANDGDVAVADHNLPTALGCPGGESEGDDDDVNCEDGIDPANGGECDGGPAANGDDGEED